MIASAVTVALVVYADIDTPLRPFLVLWFLLVCPGMALLRFVQIRNGAMQLTVAVALSVAIDTLVALGFIYAGWADFVAMFTVVLGITLIAVALNATLNAGSATARGG